MILGLCGSFAVVPAVSLVSGGGGTSRHLVGPAREPGDAADPSVLPASAGVSALLLSDAALSVASAGGDDAAAASATQSVASGVAPGVAPGVVSSAPVAPAPVVPLVPPAPTLSKAPPPGAPVARAPAPPAVARPVVAPPAPSGYRDQQGVASWLDIIPTGTCANNDAPMGAVITVTNTAGVSITCKVVSRGPFGVGRVVDLAKGTFAILGPVSRGLVSVSVTW